MKIFTVTLVCLSLCGCSYFKSKLNDIKGSLIGNGYTIDTYDNYGNKVFETKGQKIKITGNKVKSTSASNPFCSKRHVSPQLSISFPSIVIVTTEERLYVSFTLPSELYDDSFTLLPVILIF